MWSNVRQPSHRVRPLLVWRDRRETLEKRLRAAERSAARGRFNLAARQALELAADAQVEIASLNRLGDLLVRSGHIDRAVPIFERVARAYADDGFWAKAIAIYKKVLRCDPRRRDIEELLPTLYRNGGLPAGGTNGKSAPLALRNL